MNTNFKSAAFLCCSLISFSCIAEWSGDISIQDRYFINDPLPVNREQQNNVLSLASKLEYYSDLNSDDKSFTFTPFVRVDQYDKERSHADIRELFYEQVFENWEIKLGVSKVYWGVTESQHLVDVINQTDNVENIDGEDKLGQPMIKASFEQDWGIVDLFILPYFRERTFQGAEGRPRFFPVVDTNQAAYESSKEQQHIDYALRWFQIFDELEVGLAVFNGTSREPLFIPGIKNNQPALLPFYPLMTQYSIDAQLTTEEWLWKFEGIIRNWKSANISTGQLENETFFALTGGFEYTFVGVLDSSADIGLVSEYLYDDRGLQATSIFQNDLMLGLRLALNDADSSEALLGMIYDIDTQEHFISLEASKRFSENWTSSLEIRGFNNVDRLSRLKTIENDDFIQLDITYYF